MEVMKMTNNEEYWKQRFIELEKSQNKKSDEYLKLLKEEYNKSLARIEKDITNWYTRLADNNEISYTNAKKLLDKKELKEFKWTVEEYIEKGKENAINQKWMKELENASARVHIEELNAIKIQIQNELEYLYDRQNKGVENLLKQQYEDTYYKSIYEIQKGLNQFEKVQKIDTEKIKKTISKPWTTDNQTFSDRIWKHKDELLNTLQKELTQATIRGDDIHKVTKKIEKDFEVSKGKAGRLVMTESAFFSSAGQKECFNSLNVKQYEIVATLDSHTSEICQKLDGKVFDMKDYEVGITAPPFHCWCRSVTAPYFNDEFTEGEQRIYKDEEGKSGYVDSKMNYREWKKKYTDNNTSTKQMKDDIIKPSYIRKNVANNYNTEIEEVAIENAINIMPNAIKDKLKNTEFEIITKGKSIQNTSWYDRNNNKFYIYEGADIYEVIHEIGHYIETRYNILNDKTYIKIREKGLENYSIYQVRELPNYIDKIGINSNKFISEQQGRIYKKDLQGKSYVDIGAKINLNCLGEYFSEGFREYYQNRNNLKMKDIDLFEYIEEILKNVK